MPHWAVAVVIVLTNSAKSEDLWAGVNGGGERLPLEGEPTASKSGIHHLWCLLGNASLPPRSPWKPADSMAQPELTQRELQILKEMLLGKSRGNRQVFYISDNTVKNHMKAI